MNENQPTTVKITQVNEQGGFLQKSIDQLAESVELLEGRLDRMLLPLAPKDEKEGVEADLVPFADFLRERAWAIQGIRNRIDSMLERLEF